MVGANGLVEPIVQARGMDAAAVLRQKMDFVLVDAADALGLEIGDARRTELRKIAYRLGSRLPEEFQGLAALLRWVEGAGDWPRITSEHPSYFYTLRAAKGPLRDLVNMLLSELAPNGCAADVHRAQGAVLRAIRHMVGRSAGTMWRIFWSGSIRLMRKARARRCSGQSLRWMRATSNPARRGIWGRWLALGVQ